MLAPVSRDCLNLGRSGPRKRVTVAPLLQAAAAAAPNASAFLRANAKNVVGLTLNSWWVERSTCNSIPPFSRSSTCLSRASAICGGTPLAINACRRWIGDTATYRTVFPTAREMRSAISVMVSASGPVMCSRAPSMSTVAEEQKADLGDIDQVDRIELRVAERQIECTILDDTRRLAQIFLHEAGWAQLSPREADLSRYSSISLCIMTERKCGIGPSVQTREFDHVADACGLAGVYKRGLRFDHIHDRSRNHEDSVDAV